MSRREKHRDAPRAAGINAVASPRQENGDRSDPTEIIDEHVIEPPQERESRPHRMECVSHVVMLKAAVAKRCSSDAPQRQQPNGERKKRYEVEQPILFKPLFPEQDRGK